MRRLLSVRLEHPGDDRLLALAQPGALAREEQVLRQLLADGRGAGDHLALLLVLLDRLAGSPPSRSPRGRRTWRPRRRPPRASAAPRCARRAPTGARSFALGFFSRSCSSRALHERGRARGRSCATTGRARRTRAAPRARRAPATPRRSRRPSRRDAHAPHAASRLQRAAQRREDRRGVRPHAAPEEERFRRLLDQHAEAVAAPRRPRRAPWRGTACRARRPCRRRARRGANSRRGSGGASSARPAEVALITRSNCSPRKSVVAARRARRRSARASARALSAVRLAIDQPRGARVEQRRRPRPAPRRPRPSAGRARRADRKPRLRVRSRTRPTPSVLSPQTPPSSKISVFTACAARARSLARRRSSGRPGA